MPDLQTSGPTAGARLIGRSAETAALAAFLRRMSSDGDALLLTGEPGVGKSALLWAAGWQA